MVPKRRSDPLSPLEDNKNPWRSTPRGSVKSKDYSSMTHYLRAKAIMTVAISAISLTPFAEAKEWEDIYRNLPTGGCGVRKSFNSQQIHYHCCGRSGNCTETKPREIKMISSKIFLLKFPPQLSYADGYYCTMDAPEFPQKLQFKKCTKHGWVPSN